MVCDRCGEDALVLYDVAGYSICEDCVVDITIDNGYGSDDDCLPHSEADYHGLVE